MADKHGPLIAKLHALAAEDPVFVDKARLISNHGTPAPLTAVLMEIDDAVLERTLVFDIDGITLRVAVAGRRLRGVLDMTGDANDPLIGQVLSQDNPESLQAIGAFLARLCSNATRVTVESLPAQDFGTPSEAGISAASLMDAADVHDVPNASPMARFLAASSTALTAFIHAADADIIATQGNAEAVELIWRDQAGPLRESQKAIFPQDHGSFLICLDPALSDGQAVAMAVDGAETSVFSYQADQLDSILASWRLITG